ncbi:uncharacterized protein LTR77_010001 [Saxophila tyrrhenica]|uniref:Enoyl reductase (ER) domain-containing protein n=1 Tax=Saxophila tyrrhenica TaxID=1690608 RepID=A0AAV9NWX7_9PEZI|nr:hypothetical protein LTR77_010001 [Saxophila tyrrhenica]
MSTQSKAILASAPNYPDHSPGSNWSLENISVPNDLKDGELLVDMLASGICHTDLISTGVPGGTPGFPYPYVAGHEGSGYVKAVGPGVKKDIKVGDPVLLSFAHCGQCESCEQRHPAYCSAFFPLNIYPVEDVFKAEDDSGVAGKFFGQSSFAKLSVVKESSVLVVRDLVTDKEELKLFAPLGCGIQTGAGATLNVAKPEERDRVMILGVGGVGLSALMAAKMLGCEQIIAVDRVKSRLELAKSLGATHSIDTTGVEDLTATFKEITGGRGPTVVIDTSAYVPLMKAAYNSLAARGTFVFVGANLDPAFNMELGITQHMMNGTRLLGCAEGDSLPEEFIPQLIKYQREGKFQLDKISKFYKAEDFKNALHDMHTGEAIKPILTW